MRHNPVSAFSFSEVFHTIVGICIMIFGRNLTPLSINVAETPKLLNSGFTAVDGMVHLAVSEIGMTVLAIFLGMIYLWTFVSVVWPCFLGLFMLGISPYAPMAIVMKDFLGNPMTVQIFCLFIFAGALIKSNVAVYLARYLITHRVCQGRPWVLTGSLLLTSYLVAFIDQVSSVFLMWPALYIIFEEVGYEKGNKYVSSLIVGCMAMILCSFCSDAVKNGAFYILSGLYAIAEANPSLNVAHISYGSYLIFAIALSMSVLVLILFLMKFVFRVDVSPLKKLDVNILNKNPLPPMDWKQKGILYLFGFYAFYMLAPSFLPQGTAIASFIQQNLLGGIVLTVFLLGFIKYKEEPIADITTTSSAFPWSVFLLIASAFLFGNAVNAPKTNISLFLEYALGSYFDGFGFTMLCIASIIVGIVVTNFFNSVVAGLIFAPVLAALANAYGFSSGPLLAVFIFTVLFGLATPAASPFAAMVFGNPWLSKKDAALYGVIYSLVVVLVLAAIGVPLATMLF